MRHTITLRTTLVSGATLVASVAMAASADTLAKLGGTVGWGDIMRWALPVSIDLLALVSGVVWLTLSLPEATRRLGQWLTLVTVAASMVLNATGHLVSSHDIVVGPPLIISVSAVPPLAAALAVHLAARVAQGDGKTTDTASELHVDTTDTPSVSVPAQTDTDLRPPAPTVTKEAEDDTAPVPPPIETDSSVPVPNAGVRLSDTELDALVVLLAGETDPPRSYRAMEDRFRELGYIASAARLRAAWGRVTVPSS